MKTWKIPLLLSYISVASSSCAIITPAFPEIENTWHVSDAQVANLVSVFLIGYFIGQLVYGPIANRFGRLFALRAGLILNLFGIIFSIIAVGHHAFNILVLARGVTALGAASGLSCTFMLLNESLDSARAKSVLSFAGISFTAAVGFAVYIGGLVTHYWDWIDCFWVLLAYGGLLLGLTWVFDETLKTKKSIHPASIYRSYLHAFRNPRLLAYSFLIGSVGMISYTNSVAAPLISHGLLNLSAAEYGSWFLLNSISMVVGSFIASYWLKKMSADQILKIAVIAMLVLTVVLAILFGVFRMHNAFCFFFLTAGLFLLSSIVYPAAGHIASNAIEDKPSASSAMNFIAVLVSVLSVWVMGLLPFPMFWSFIFVAIVYFAIVRFWHAKISLKTLEK